MTVLRSMLAVGGFALIAGLMPAAHAQPKSPAPGGGGAPQGDQFQFRLCNKSQIPLFVAMLYKASDNSWRAHGWLPYKPGHCAPANGTFPRNDFYWYAEDAGGDVVYAGKDAFGCINSSEGFDRTISGAYDCEAKEKVVGFTKIDDASIRDGITLTD